MQEPISNAFRRLLEKVGRANAIQHSGGTVPAEDWAELHRMVDEGKALLEDNPAAPPADGSRRFYRHTYEVVVLSESPDHDTIYTIAGNVDGGPDCLARFSHVKEEELSGKEAAAALYAAGSEPGFFDLDEEGNPQE